MLLNIRSYLISIKTLTKCLRYVSDVSLTFQTTFTCFFQTFFSNVFFKRFFQTFFLLFCCMTIMHEMAIHCVSNIYFSCSL